MEPSLEGQMRESLHLQVAAHAQLLLELELCYAEAAVASHLIAEVAIAF